MIRRELVSRPRRGIRLLKKAVLEARTITRKLKVAIKIHRMTGERAEITRIGAMVAKITTNSVVVEVARITMIAEQLQETIEAVLETSGAEEVETEERTKEKAEEGVTVDEVETMLAEAKVVEVIATTTSVSSLMRTVPTPL